MDIAQTLDQLRQEGNYRTLPPIASNDAGIIDLSSNDYMGLACHKELQERFFAIPKNRTLPITSSASRLLASAQEEYYNLENKLSELYDRPILLFNSGYHANVGLIAALADNRTLVIADRLVHASIIDGIILSKAPFTRFRHNDYEHLDNIMQRNTGNYDRMLIVTESIFSMDGDSADIDKLAMIKRQYPSSMLYVDEAHAFGVVGEHGLGLSKSSPNYHDVDIVIGTFGKAAASMGAFCAMSQELKEFAINRSRSLIFSTALPPICCAWTGFVIDQLLVMDKEREHLGHIAKVLYETLKPLSDHPIMPSHIQPWVIGNAQRAVELSAQLQQQGFKALPIRTPTVPHGTERLRFSLSAAITVEQITELCDAIKRIIA